MSYTRVNFQNKPSTATPINATNLNTMDAGIAANDAAIGTLNTAVQGKVDKVEGKGLSTNDFTDEDALKLAGIEDGAEVNVQADWDEADNTADDYIKNKPDLSVYAEKDALWQDATASGNPVTIKTQSAQIAKSTILTMSPIQSGSGTPSPDNVRPISGRTQAVIDGYGKNFMQFPALDDTVNGVKYLSENNTLSIKRTASSSSNSSPINSATMSAYSTLPWGPFPSGTYSVIVKDFIGQATTDRITFTARYDDDTAVVESQRISGESNQIPNGTGRKVTFTATKPFKYGIWMVVTSSTNIDCVAKIQMEHGTEITEIEPYNKHSSVTIDLGQTVYGGTLDVETGLLTIEWVSATIDGDAVSSINGSSGTDSLGGKRVDTNISGAYYAGSASGDVAQIISDQLVAVSSSNIYTGNPQPNTVSVSGANIVVLRYDGVNTKENAQAALNANPIQVCYKLATPTTTTLTAAQVNLIKGLNNVSTDADGISLTYFADGESLTDADNRITAVLGDFATVEGARASQNYSTGDYLIFSDKFCKASAAIATGEALAIGTNLTQTTIGAELKAIFAQL